MLYNRLAVGRCDQAMELSRRHWVFGGVDSIEHPLPHDPIFPARSSAPRGSNHEAAERYIPVRFHLLVRSLHKLGET